MEIITTTTILEKSVNVYGTLEDPLFLAKDVSEWIEHSNTSEMLRGVDEDEKLVSTILSSGQNRQVSMLTENGLYEVLMQSRKPIAKSFKKGIKEMLKSVRKHGMYATPSTTEEILNNPDVMISLLQNLKNERAQKEALQIANNKLNAKTKFIDIVFNSDTLLSFEQAAKVLGLPYGRNTLVKKLKELGILFKNKTSPKQNYVGRGFFRVKEDFKPEINKVFAQTFITQKGLAFIAGKLNVITPTINKAKSIA